MLVRFIAHAGIAIEEDGYQLLIDPWFLDSTIEHPVIESIGATFKTIDFQIPKTTEEIKDYAPDAVALSHFHAHHSPARDIQMLCANSLNRGKNIHILHPKIGDAEPFLSSRLPTEVLRHPMVAGEKFTVGPFVIRAEKHTLSFHNSWFVSSRSGSVLHIADASFHSNGALRSPDPIWKDLSALSPSVLFVSMGSHQRRISTKEGGRSILPASTLLPTEAALVTQILSPRAVGGIGFYNSSIWRGRLEYMPPTFQTEEEFEWAISWLAPHIRNIRLLPGHTFGIGDTALREICTTYIVS